MLPPPLPESIRESEEVFLVDRVQYLDYGLLHDLVLHCGYPQRAQFAVRFENVRSPRGLRTVCPGVYLPVQFVYALIEDVLVVPPRHAVHAHRRRFVEVVETFDQQRRGDVVQQCREF